MYCMDHELEVVVQGQVGSGDRGADDGEEEGRLHGGCMDAADCS